MDRDSHRRHRPLSLKSALLGTRAEAADSLASGTGKARVVGRASMAVDAQISWGMLGVWKLRFVQSIPRVESVPWLGDLTSRRRCEEMNLC